MLILVVDATGKTFASSLFVVAYIAPTALLGTVSGRARRPRAEGPRAVGHQRRPRRPLRLLAISSGSVLPIYIIAVLFAVAGQFSSPAESAALPVVVEPEDYTSANSLNNLGQLIAQIAGLLILPPLFLKTVGAPPLAVVCAIMFVAAGLQFLLIPGLGGEVRSIDMSVEDTRERFAEAWHRLTLDSVAYIAVIIAVLANTTGLVMTTLMPNSEPGARHQYREHHLCCDRPPRAASGSRCASSATVSSARLPVVERRRILRRPRLRRRRCSPSSPLSATPWPMLIPSASSILARSVIPLRVS